MPLARHRVPLLPVTLAFLLACATDTPAPRTCDLCIRHGTVVDGSGGEPFRADIAIVAGRIAAVGALDDWAATRTLDATGLVVAPGFVDVHTHADSEALVRPEASNFVAMGVTTIVTGNCGGSVPDLATHLAKVEQQGISVNYGSLVGHGTVRTQVLGLRRRAPDAEEMERMKTLVRKAMDAGALGLSTGLIYVPGTYAQTEELIELARVVAPYGGLYASHMRNENDRVEAAVEEALRIGREAGVPVQVSHLKATGRPNWGKSTWLLARLARARAEGQRVLADQYAYPASGTGLDILFPSTELEVGREAFARRLLEDQEFRARMASALHTTMDRMGFGDLRYCRIAHAPGSAELDGLTIAEAAQRRRGSAERMDQAQTAIDLVVRAAGKRVSMIYFTIGEEDIATILADPSVAVASDSGIRGTGEGKPHPRGAGNNARVLGRYVRDEHVLPLPLAVRKMSALPAQAFGLRERGTIALGMAADLVLFDPARVAERATWDEPLLPPDGIPWVLVNGVVVVEQGKHTGARPGQVLRRR